MAMKQETGEAIYNAKHWGRNGTVAIANKIYKANCRRGNKREASHEIACVLYSATRNALARAKGKKFSFWHAIAAWLCFRTLLYAKDFITLSEKEGQPLSASQLEAVAGYYIPFYAFLKNDILDLLSKAKKLAQELDWKERNEVLALIESRYGQYYMLEGDMNLAGKHYLDAYHEHVFPETDPRISTRVMRDYGNFLCIRKHHGDFEEGMNFLLKAKQICLETPNMKDPLEKIEGVIEEHLSR